MQNIITTILGFIGVGGYAVFGAGLKSWEDWAMGILAVAYFYFTNNTVKFGQKLASTITTGCGIAFSVIYALTPLLTTGQAPTASVLVSAATIAGLGWVTNNTSEMGPLQAFIQKLNLKNPA